MTTETWEQSIARQQAEAKEKILSKADALAAAGVALVMVQYSGTGDEGNIDDMLFFSTVPDDPESTEPDIRQDTIPNASKPDDEDFYPLLPPGFENNEGGQGYVTFDVAAKKLTRHHGDNVTTVEYRGDEEL
jgi:hypothetical protein